MARFERSRAAAAERAAFLPDPAQFPDPAPPPVKASPPASVPVPAPPPVAKPAQPVTAESPAKGGFHLPGGMERYIVIGIAVLGLAALATPVAIFFGLRGRTDKPAAPASVQASVATPAPAPPPARPAPAVVPAPAPTVVAAPPPVVVPAAPPPAPRPAPVVAAPVREATRPSQEMEAPIVPVTAPAAVPKQPAPPAAKPSGKRWVFKGRVYDLINLSPVYDAKLSFMDPSGREAASTVTKDEGMFEVSLDALPKGGYTLTVYHMDYRPKYMDDINPPFDQIDDKMRRPLADAAPVNKPWVGSSDKPTKRDFVMVPKTIE
ncbi:MAG: carboxypeptidase regulatory-like domain-containing protein [Elusimicrobia bacterium]|nr:carboxypeptidase regulatory-like domain-containing protein [Elusimicrobiota bacterium]